jgi:hypothetical protein
MVIVADQPAQNSFIFSEYFLMPKPTGKKAGDLREFLQYLREVTEPVLTYHLWEYRLTFTQPIVEYPNDFALWAATGLHDPNLAERLSDLDLFDFADMTQVREVLVELLEDYMWDFHHNPQVQPGYEFYFCEASAVVMNTGIEAKTLREFCRGLGTVGLDSVYYHFVEARRRLGDRKMDDFSHWIDTNFGLPALVADIRDIDIYFYTLTEIRNSVLSLISEEAGESCDQPA